MLQRRRYEYNNYTSTAVFFKYEWESNKIEKGGDILMVNNTPYVRKKISSTLIALSAASMLLPLLLTISPLLFNLQAVQASSSSYPISYQTTKPAGGYTSCTSGEVWLTFDAQGYYNPAGGGDGNVNSGKFQVTNSSGEILISGDMKSGDYNNSTGSGGRLTIVQPTFDHAPKGCSSNPNLVILTSCSSSDDNLIRFHSVSGGFAAQFSGPVKCSLVGNTNTTQQQQPSPMTGTTTQDGGGGSSSDGDSDSDGIPDSSDNCPNHSHHRCFKEGDTSTTTTTTTHEQQPSSPSSSSSNRTGNQTR
jgi:hypothetical protein